MAIRTDLTIDWSVTPRVILVDAPSTEITMQDLLDSLRYFEALPTSMDNAPIVDSSGKEPLDSVTKNGLTVALLDARLGFEARADWTQCSFSGGNLVAFDGAQVQARQVTASTPVYPTPFVNIDRASSSSGTLQEQDALQYSSYQNAVWIDVNSSNVGIAFPSGTREYPVNNVQDAVLIGKDKGFDTLSIIGSISLGAGDDVTNFKIEGTNPMTSQIFIAPEAICTNVYVYGMTFAGTLDGGSLLRECLIGNPVYYFNGFIEHCALASNAIIYVQGDAVIMNSRSVGYPKIDMTNGNSIFVSNYDGDLIIDNQILPQTVTHIVSNGEIIINNTCTEGKLEVHGDVKVTNNGTIPDVEDNTTGTPLEIATAVWDTQL